LTEPALPAEPFFHIVARADWPIAGSELVAASVGTEGFAHCSYARDVAESANRHFAADADLIALEIDPSLVTAPVKIEQAKLRGTNFPHVYGPIPVVAVIAAWPLERGADGFSFSRGNGSSTSDR
jgi:uncharacterized protein (DUF952 family)